MKHKINCLLLFFYLPQTVDAITLVYNMKIRRVFAASALLRKEKKSIWVATAVPIIYKRERHIVDEDLGINICEKIKSGGSLFNLRYVRSKTWWLEATTGIEKERVTSQSAQPFTASRTGLDDIVISGGHNMFFKENIQFVLYGIAGFPTRRNVTLQEAQNALVGTRFFSLGVGAELSYSFVNTLKKSFIVLFQSRFLHFFKRNWSPILPAGAKIQPGNVTDLLFTAQYRKRRNIFEAGYNPTFFTNQAVILKTVTIKGKNSVRNSIYANFAHICKNFPILTTPVIVGAGFSLGESERFDTKNRALWLNISTIF